MREIKFRAWDKEDKKMHYSEDMAEDFEKASSWWHLREDQSMTASQFDTPIMQSTGLLDKNGKDIYEGDIVVVPKKYPFFTPPEGSDINLNDYPDIENGVRNYVGIVEWIYSQWQVVLQCVNPKASGISDGMNDGLNDDGIDEGGKSGWEVIGNIHENPELLK